ncbi:uncharacterized protein LOC103844421 [Brassica rapa]|uniref:uncharacterized protein LOC103844421 n=1 Tax=Brassica campestris TaxID=3711 RepID=UPI00142D4FE5|nr:uncharacterized protein LOC103844421 [Brassica rapa]
MVLRMMQLVMKVLGGVSLFTERLRWVRMSRKRDEQVFEDTEVRPVVVYQPRDDGTGLVLGQEFRTKEEAKVHIQTASHKKCFEFDITKSDTQRFVVKCRGAKDGCKWFVRVAKLKKEYIFGRLEVTSSIIHVLLLLQEHCLIEGKAHHKSLHLFWLKIILHRRVQCDEESPHCGWNTPENVYGGVLLVATAQDPDHHHYPIAFGVADGENDESWIWFMEQLKSVISDVPGLVFLSDRNKSLIKSVRLVFPEAEHGYCIWHLSQNVKAHVHNNKDTCASKFRDCAHAYTEAEFKYQYHAFRRRYPSAAAYLDKSVEEKKWARCYFRGDRYNVDTTNSVESFNGVIKEARKYTLLPMFDVIIAKMSEWFNNHRKEAAEIPYTLKLVPILETEMSKRCIDAGFLTIDELNSFHLEYSVHGTDGKVYTVDMARNTCSCEQFDKDKYPCVHAVAAATFMSKAAGRELHLSETIYPVPHMSDWVIPEDVKAKKILPPDYDKKKGKPQQTRFPSVGESRGRGKRGRGGARGARGRGRARGEGMASYFECGSGSGTT